MHRPQLAGRAVVCRVWGMMLGISAATASYAAAPPLVQPHDNFQNVTRLPDGTLWRLASRFNAVYRSFSTDNGLTWQGGFTTSSKLFDAFGGLNPVPVVGADGTMHLFVPRRPESGPAEFDIFHYQSSAPYSQWSAGELIHDGNTGSMLKAIETSTGRLIAPFGDKAIVPPAGYGNGTTVVRYRDNNSASFLLSPSRMQSQVPTNWNGASDGATEPTVIERPDGKLWMLMRSQTGKLTESFSTNFGTTWTPATDSKFHTTTGPPCLVPLDNGNMVLLWNNATMPSRYNGQIWYAGRDVLHAAISQDGGQTWKGFREIYLDPFRNQDPVAGDTGTAYPFATATSDGKLLAITGQAAAKAQIRIDPAWLLEKDRADDFSAPNAMDNWSVFKPYGSVVNVKRARVAGAQLIDDPDPSRTKPVLHIRRPDDKDADGATWNFPATSRGRTQVRLKLQPGFAGGVISLADRFFNPTDDAGEANAFYRLAISPTGELPGGHSLTFGAWHDIVIDWNANTRNAIVRLNDVQIGTIDAQAGAEMWPGLSYLRLRSTASTVDTAGFLVDQVRHTASNLRDSTRLRSAVAEAALSNDTGWTAFRFDDYQLRGSNADVNRGTVDSFASPFQGFLSLAGVPAAGGVQLESSSGTVTFADATSTKNTSDVVGPKHGESITIRFVDPTDPIRPATVSHVAFRLGSIAEGNVRIRLFDVEGIELPDWQFGTAPSGVAGVIGYTATEESQVASLIHAIELTSLSDDTWVLGSYVRDPNLPDLAYKGFTVAAVPEPSAVVTVPACGLMLIRRRALQCDAPNRRGQ